MANDASPTAAAPPLYVVSDLNQAFGHDLVLMRCHLCTALRRRPSPTKHHRIFPGRDSYDFTGLSAQTAGTVVQCGENVRVALHPAANPAVAIRVSRPFQSPHWARAVPILDLICTCDSPPPNAPLLVADSLPLNVPTVAPKWPMPPASKTWPASYTGMTLTIQIDNIDFGGPVKLGRVEQAGLAPTFFSVRRNGPLAMPTSCRCRSSARIAFMTPATI